MEKAYNILGTEHNYNIPSIKFNLITWLRLRDHNRFVEHINLDDKNKKRDKD